jgi:hypothetical protein
VRWSVDAEVLTVAELAITAYPVSTWVNTPTHNDACCVEPLAA